MASKKLKKAMKAALIGFAGAKMLGARNKAMAKAAQVDTGDLGLEMANDTALASAMRKSMLPKKKPISKSSGADILGYGDAFGLGPMDGAKAGKMIKAKNGVMARGCKLGRNKRTIIT
jgi:hypothetical protein